MRVLEELDEHFAHEIHRLGVGPQALQHEPVDEPVILLERLALPVGTARGDAGMKLLALQQRFVGLG